MIVADDHLRPGVSPTVEEREMKRDTTNLLILLIANSGLCYGQVSGNIGYSQPGGKAKAEQNERSQRLLTKEELPPTGTSTFIEARALMNVKADEYVAILGIAQEGKSVEECSRKMEATIKEFSDALKALKIPAEDLYVDFVAQNKIYGYEVTGDIAQEKLVGFELKKNISIHYQARDLLDRIVVEAARSQIFDLIKVDYLVKDFAGIHDRLMEEAAKMIKKKASRYETLLGIKLQPPVQVYTERYATYFPSEHYDSYVAFGAEEMGGAEQFRQKYTTKSARKSRTFFFNGLSTDGFDAVINPVVIEPVIQVTLYLKIRYEVEQLKAK
jgi:uncharacterized protein YggE